MGVITHSHFTAPSPFRSLTRVETDWLGKLPGRHFIPIAIVKALLGFDPAADLKKSLKGAFTMDWQQQLGAVPRGERGRDRPFFFPTEKFRLQNGVEIQTAEEGGGGEAAEEHFSDDEFLEVHL